jgi:BirA family biotin operon repressor/biotin-[acetyl-CoA-carboxylase] ligase
MTPPREVWHLDTRRIGRRVLCFDRLDSTNTQAARMAVDPSNDGVVVLAQEQTAGRGQHGRTWQCPAGAGVLLSVLVFPPPYLCRPSVLTAWAAVAVCETIRRATGFQARIKWPNDVVLRGRKVGGILIESRVPSCARPVEARNTDLWSVVGIGVNVNQSAQALADAGLPQAGSLALFQDQPLRCAEVAGLLIRQLDEDYNWLLQGDLTGLEACWKWRVGLLGRNVVAECGSPEPSPARAYRGRLRDLAWEGLDLELPNGDRLRLPPESVRHLRPG